MPAFLFISGYLSKNVVSHRMKDLETLLYPFVIFQIVYILFYVVGTAGTFRFNLFAPVYLTWYLVTLFFCRLFLPYLRMINTKTCLVVLFLMAIVSGFYVDNGFLAFYRTLYFLPVFYIGFKWNDIEESVAKLYKFKYLLMALLFVLCVVVFLASSYSMDYYSRIRLCISTDHNYSGSSLVALGKICGYFLSFIMMTSFFLITHIIDKKNEKVNVFFEQVGRHSMSVYTLHGFFVLGTIPFFSRYLPLWLNIITSITMSLLLCYVFSRKKVVHVFKFAFDFKELKRLIVIKQIAR